MSNLIGRMCKHAARLVDESNNPEDFKSGDVMYEAAERIEELEAGFEALLDERAELEARVDGLLDEVEALGYEIKEFRGEA